MSGFVPVLAMSLERPSRVARFPFRSGAAYSCLRASSLKDPVTEPSGQFPWKKLLLAAGLAALVAAFFIFDLGRFLGLQALQQRREALAAIYLARPLATLGGFFAIYFAVAALSLPGAVILTLAAGALFGLLLGTVLVSFASTLGATASFLSSRYLLRALVERHFGARLASVNQGIARDGPLYLFSLRLVPAFPFFIVNLLLGLTQMKALTFYWVSQLGMLAGTLVFVNAGTQLAKLESLGGVLSPELIGSFVLLGLFPLAARKGLAAWQRRRAGSEGKAAGGDKKE